MLVVGFLAGATALSTLAAGTWTGPTAGCSPTAAGCNVDAPVNVGGASQVKIGLLGLNDAMIKNLQVLTAEGTSTGVQGKVLTAIDNNGTVGWRSATTPVTDTVTLNHAVFSYNSGYDTIGGMYSSTNGEYTWIAPAGVGSVTVEVIGAGAGADTGDNGGGCGAGGCGRGGGGGGEYAKSTISVTPGTSYAILVGKGGVTSSYSDAHCPSDFTPRVATNGGKSSFASTTVVANGGKGPHSGPSPYGARCWLGGSGGSGGTGELLRSGTDATQRSSGTCGGDGGNAYFGNTAPYVSLGGSCPGARRASGPGAGSAGGTSSNYSSSGMDGQVRITW